MIPLHIHTSTQTGGAAKVARVLHQSQRDAGIDAKFIAGWGPANADAEIYSFRSARGPVDLANVAAYRAASVEGPLNASRWNQFLSSDIYASADLIHLHNAHGYYLPSLVLDRLLDKPCVWTLHDFWMMTGRCASPSDCLGFESGCSPCPHRLRYPGSLVDRASADFVRRRDLWGKENMVFVTPTESTRQRFVDQGLPADQIRTISNPVSFSARLAANTLADEQSAARGRLSIGAGRTVILFSSRRVVDPLKGLDVALKALAGLGPRADLYAIFVGEVTAKVRSEIDKLDIETRIAGLIADPDLMDDFLLATDIVIAPSRSETFGLLLVEAALAGAAIVASDLPAIRDVLGPPGHGPWLKLQSPDDHSGFTTSLSEMIESKPYPSAQDRARLRGRFEAGGIARQYSELYREILSARLPT